MPGICTQKFLFIVRKCTSLLAVLCYSWRAGAPVDWWALGVVLYQFLVGITPFFGETVEELFDQITDDAVMPKFPDDIPFAEDAQDIIEQLLIRDPNLRLGSKATGKSCLISLITLETALGCVPTDVPGCYITNHSFLLPEK